MPKKINQKLEKRARNELYADRYKKEDGEDVKTPKKKTPSTAKFANWCRVLGHPSDCQCTN